jgi:signal transduction histidine kinase
MSLRKNNRARLSFSLRLALLYTCVLCFSLAAVLSGTYQLVRRISLNRDHDVIMAQTGQYKTLFEQGGVSAVSRYFTQQFATSPEQRFIRVIDANNQVRFITVSHPLWTILDQKTNLLARISSSTAQQWDELFRDDRAESWIIGTTPLNGGLYLQVGRSNSESRLMLQHFRNTVLKIIVPAILLSLLAGWLTTRSAVRPLRTLIETIRNILATGDMKQRVPVRAQRGEPDELTTLFNRLLDQNEVLIRSSRDTLDNVAHDLRTPMTHLRNATERVLLNPDAEAETLREALADCAEESDKILQILNLLMDMAEAATGQMKLKPEAIQLHQLAEEVAELYAPIAEERQIHLTNAVPLELTVTADRLRLRQCLINLVDNALKYSPKKTAVCMDGSESSDGVEIRVCDQGTGIASEELPKIWERLYRGEQSRSTSGLGLGLSFVQAILAAHGGRVDVKTRLNEGSTFILHLPR